MARRAAVAMAAAQPGTTEIEVAIPTEAVARGEAELAAVAMTEAALGEAETRVGDRVAAKWAARWAARWAAASAGAVMERAVAKAVEVVAAPRAAARVKEVVAAPMAVAAVTERRWARSAGVRVAAGTAEALAVGRARRKAAEGKARWMVEEGRAAVQMAAAAVTETRWAKLADVRVAAGWGRPRAAAGRGKR